VSSSEVKALHRNISKQKFVASKVSSGNIFLEISERLKVSVKCDMDFTDYPFDTQNCPFLILSLRNQKIKWIIKRYVKFSNLIHPDFQIVGKLFENSSITEDETNISVAGFRLLMSRNPALFIYAYFIPCSLMVATSWISFAVNYDAVPGRLGMLLTLLLVLINLSNSVSRTVPKSNKVCPLVLWIIISIIFVSMALLEYFIILVHIKFSKKNRVNQKPEETLKYFTSWALKQDRIALTLFPFAYLLAITIFLVEFV